MGIRVLVAAALCAPLLATAAAAPADAVRDKRPCVAQAEYRSIFATDASESRRKLEARWEVKGLGQQVDLAEYIPIIDGPAWKSVAYPRCGYEFEHAWYAVIYRSPAVNQRQVAMAAVEWHDKTFTPIENPRRGRAGRGAASP